MIELDGLMTAAPGVAAEPKASAGAPAEFAAALALVRGQEGRPDTDAEPELTPAPDTTEAEAGVDATLLVLGVGGTPVVSATTNAAGPPAPVTITSEGAQATIRSTAHTKVDGISSGGGSADGTGAFTIAPGGSMAPADDGDLARDVDSPPATSNEPALARLDGTAGRGGLSPTLASAGGRSAGGAEAATATRAEGATVDAATPIVSGSVATSAPAGSVPAGITPTPEATPSAEIVAIGSRPTEAAPSAAAPTDTALMDIAPTDIAPTDIAPTDIAPTELARSETASTPVSNAVAPQIDSTATTADVADAAPATPRTVTDATPAQQVAEALRDVRRLADGSHRLSLQLHPEELGAVQLEVAVRDGQLHVRAVAETDAARAALEQHLPELRSELRDAGVRAGSLEVGPDASGRDRTDDRPDQRRSPATGPDDAAPGPVPSPETSTEPGLDIRL